MKNTLSILFLIAFTAFSQKDTSLVGVQKFTVKSEKLNSDREFWVSLPLNYDSTFNYPVIYVLDAEWRFGISNSIEKELSTNGKIPQHIVVGIPHPDRKPDMTFSTTKTAYDGASAMDTNYFGKQNTGNGPQFLAFLEDELIPQINNKYATNGFNILVGHSLGGYFCSFILPEQKSFGSLQIYDPSLWYSQGEATTHLKDQLSEDKKCNIYIATSSDKVKDYKYHHKKISEFNKALKKFKNIKHEHHCYRNEDHNSMFMHAFLDGISLLYQNYEIDSYDEKNPLTYTRLTNHFKSLSEEHGFEFSPPTHTYLDAGRSSYAYGETIECIKALEIYTSKVQDNAYSFELLGDAYITTGKKPEAIKSYKTSFKLNANNPRIKEKIKNLEK